MPSYRPESHKTLIALLRQERKARKLSLRKAVARLPEWMNFQYSTLAARVEEILSAKERATHGSRRKK